jgi:ubiquitin-protein ligase
MQNVRLRRLKADYEAMRRLVRLHPRIELEGVAGNPPERYRLVLRVKSLRERGDEIETAAEHRLEMTLPLGYPRDAPLFRMLTPVFHPNIAPHAVCIGDHWTASEPIDALVQRIGELLAFQSYNTKSPLNGAAAQWAEQHRERLPVDAEEFFVDLEQLAERALRNARHICANCGAHAPDEAGGAQLPACAAGHALCGDCLIRCPRCAGVVCLVCDQRACPSCQPA